MWERQKVKVRRQKSEIFVENFVENFVDESTSFSEHAKRRP